MSSVSTRTRNGIETHTRKRMGFHISSVRFGEAVFLERGQRVPSAQPTIRLCVPLNYICVPCIIGAVSCNAFQGLYLTSRFPTLILTFPTTTDEDILYLQSLHFPGKYILSSRIRLFSGLPSGVYTLTYCNERVYILSCAAPLGVPS